MDKLKSLRSKVKTFNCLVVWHEYFVSLCITLYGSDSEQTVAEVIVTLNIFRLSEVTITFKKLNKK